MKVCLVISRPRSGSTVLKQNLAQHPQVCEFGEIFNEGNKRSIYHYLSDLSGSDATWLFPSRRRELLRSYLSFKSEAALKTKPSTNVIVADVKYDHSHLVYDAWRGMDSPPVLFEEIIKNQWYVLNLTRRNVLAMFISNEIALKTGIYHKTKMESSSVHQKTFIDVNEAYRYCTSTKYQYSFVSNYFRSYDRYLEICYEDLFTGAHFNEHSLRSIELLLDLDESICRDPKLTKILAGDLYDYIENRDEVIESLIPRLQSCGV